jgi:hypothetical protein
MQKTELAERFLNPHGRANATASACVMLR